MQNNHINIHVWDINVGLRVLPSTNCRHLVQRNWSFCTNWIFCTNYRLYTTSKVHLPLTFSHPVNRHPYTAASPPDSHSATPFASFIVCSIFRFAIVGFVHIIVKFNYYVLPNYVFSFRFAKFAKKCNQSPNSFQKFLLCLLITVLQNLWNVIDLWLTKASFYSDDDLLFWWRDMMTR